MSNLQRSENLKQIVATQELDFKKLSIIHNAVHFEREASFALQILEDNRYLAEVAYNNPDSLKRAVLNVAAVGLSLSPVFKYAYLVPRKKKVCLDISYQGLTKLATDIGSIKWAAAEVVRANDTFIYRGADEKPTHEFKPFGDRGAIVGGYVLTKLPDDGYLVVYMSLDQIYSIRNRSEAWKAYQEDKSKINPWVTDEEEMIKKTLIKRSWKTWPKSEKFERLAEAVELTNEADGIVFDTTAIEVTNDRKDADLRTIRDGLAYLKKQEPKFLEYCIKANKRDLKGLEDMTEIELSQAASYISQLVEKQKEVENAAS